MNYIIGGHSFALNEIENGVLRSNRKAIGAVTKPFSRSDPRLKIALPAPEPKIHFALVCGAKSCPPIKTYSASVRIGLCFTSDTGINTTLSGNVTALLKDWIII